MATGGDPEPTDLYTCQVCLEDQTERNPRLLSCHHSFCETCLKKLVKKGKVECPTCRQVTLVAEDDVANLSINFMLLKMKDPKKQHLCHVCGVMAADKKCQECSNLLCDPCIMKHESNEVFKGHMIFPVCPEHQHGIISYVCLKCFKGVCSICRLNDHSEHKEDVVMYREGINKITESIQKMKDDLSETVVVTPEQEGKNQENQKLQKDMEEKSEKMRKIIDKIKAQNNNMRCISSKNEEAMKQIEELTMCLLEPDKTILKLYPILKENTDKLLTMVEDENLMHSLIVDKECETFQFKNEWNKNMIFEKDTVVDVYRESCFTHKLIYETTNMDQFKIFCPMRIQSLMPLKATVCDLVVSMRDAIIDIETSSSFPQILDNTYDNANDAVYRDGFCWYISSKENTIYKCHWFTADIDFVHETNLKRVTKIFPGISSKMIIYDNILHRVYELLDHKLKWVATDIIVDHITVNKINEFSEGYVVTNTFDSTFRFYDEDWQFDHEINAKKKQIKGPSECVSTQMGLLVANTGNNCITLLDHQGELIDACVLGEADGIRRPVSIDYMEPYLWIAECDRYEGHRSIKCFELHSKG